MWRIGTRSLVKRPDLRRSCLRSSFAIRSAGRPSSLPASQCCLSKLYTKKDSETLPVATLPSQLPSTSPLLSLLASWRPTQHKHRGSLRTRALLKWWPSQASIMCDAPQILGDMNVLVIRSAHVLNPALYRLLLVAVVCVWLDDLIDSTDGIGLLA